MRTIYDTAGGDGQVPIPTPEEMTAEAKREGYTAKLSSQMFMIIAIDELQKRLEAVPPVPKEETLREINGDYSQAVGNLNAVLL
jgi:hypothetical protein